MAVLFLRMSFIERADIIELSLSLDHLIKDIIPKSENTD